MKFGLKSAFLMIGLVSLIATKSMAAGFCFGHAYLMPDFGMSYTYAADCSWTKKEISKSTVAWVGYVSAKERADVKAAVSQKLAHSGYNIIAQLHGFDVYSDQPLTAKSMCVDYMGDLECTQNAAVYTNLLQNQGLEKTLEDSGYQKIADFDNIVDNTGVVGTVSIYVK